MAVSLITGTLPPSLIYFSALVILPLFALYLLVYRRQVAQWRHSNIPFLPPVFLLGHKYVLDLKNQAFTKLLDRIYYENRSKDVVAFFMGTTPLILIRDPALIRQLYVKNLSKLFSTGLTTLKSDVEAQYMIAFTASKAMWKFGHTVMSPMFLPRRLEGANFEKIKKQVARLLSYAEKTELSNRPLELEVMARNFAIDAISLVHFGEASNSYEKKGTLHKIDARFTPPTLGRMLAVFSMFHFPWLQHFKALKFISPESCAEMAEILQRKMKERDQLNVNEDDFIDFIRTLRDKNVSRGKEAEDITDLHTHEEVTLKAMVAFGLTLVLATIDTVRMMSTYALHLLSLHPQHQDRIKKEIDEVMKKHAVSELDFSVIEELQFTRQCLYETARLYPAVQVMIRLCSEDFQIPGTKYFLRKGNLVAVSPYSIHRDPKYFKNPDQFEPDRFSPENRDQILPETFLTFGIGPRACPAYKQGMVFAATVVAAIVSKYKIKPHSHRKQMDAADFHSRSFLNLPARPITINIVRR